MLIYWLFRFDTVIVRNKPNMTSCKTPWLWPGLWPHQWPQSQYWVFLHKFPKAIEHRLNFFNQSSSSLDLGGQLSAYQSCCGNEKKSKGVIIITRHVPGSQTHFSLYLDGDQNKEDTVFTYVVDYGIYIHTSRPIQFCCFPNENFEKNVKEPARIPETGSRIQKGFCRFSQSSN